MPARVQQVVADLYLSFIAVAGKWPRAQWVTARASRGRTPGCAAAIGTVRNRMAVALMFVLLVGLTGIRPF